MFNLIAKCMDAIQPISARSSLSVLQLFSIYLAPSVTSVMCILVHFISSDFLTGPEQFQFLFFYS